MAEQIFSGIGQLIIAGGGSAVVAYGLFVFFGKSLVKHQLLWIKQCITHSFWFQPTTP